MGDTIHQTQSREHDRNSRTAHSIEFPYASHGFLQYTFLLLGGAAGRKNTPRYTAGVPKKPHGPRVSEIDQLVRFGDLTELCVSASLPPDITSMGVPDTHKNLKTSVTCGCHDTNQF